MAATLSTVVIPARDGQSRLLEKNPKLDASIRLRLPYIAPLNRLQIELMKRHRAGEDDPRVGEGICCRSM